MKTNLQVSTNLLRTRSVDIRRFAKFVDLKAKS